MHPKNEDFLEFLSFIESVRGASKRLLKSNDTLESPFRMVGKDLGCVLKGSRFARKIVENGDFSLRRVTVNARVRV